MSERDGCTPELVERFNNLPYKNKIIFTCNKYENYDSTKFIEDYKNEDEIGNIISYYGILGKRRYDKYFDYIEYINNI